MSLIIFFTERQRTIIKNADGQKKKSQSEYARPKGLTALKLVSTHPNYFT